MILRDLFLLVLCLPVSGATLNVADYGAKGNAVTATISATSGSGNAVVTSTNLFSAADIGNTILIYGAGETTSGTNHQDYIGLISGVSAQTNLTITPAPRATLARASATIGTDNTTAFRDCIADLDGTNDVINVPSGSYLLMPPYMLTNGTGVAWSSLLVSRGGFTMIGTNATLLGNSAWQLHGGAAVRGVLLELAGPVVNNYPVIFDGIAFDGGLIGYTSNHGFPAHTETGDGWDVTHDAVLQTGTAPVLSQTTFRNCAFQHWRGEMFKSLVDTTSGGLTLTDCTFTDGNASGYNSGFNHTLTRCRFERLFLAAEVYQGYITEPCAWDGCTLTNVDTGIVFGGALANRAEPLYTIKNSVIGGYPLAIFPNPGRNLLISGNTIVGGALYMGGAGVQGTDMNADWTVTNNVFSNSWVASIYSGGWVVSSNIVIVSNRFDGGQLVASGFGECYGVAFSHNTATNGTYNVLDSRSITGEWFIDDGSNNFGTWINGDGVGVTTTISGALGMKQSSWSSTPNSIFVIGDASDAGKVPSGARIQITHTGPYPAVFRCGETVTTMRTGSFASYVWSGSAWYLQPAIRVNSLRVGGGT